MGDCCLAETRRINGGKRTIRGCTAVRVHTTTTPTATPTTPATAIAHFEWCTFIVSFLIISDSHTPYEKVWFGLVWLGRYERSE